MRFSHLATWVAFSGPASAVSFISPPPPSAGTAADFGANPVYAESSAIEVAWTDTQDNGIPFSVVVYQVDPVSAEMPASQAFEYVVHDAVNRTNSHWVVATAKNLTFSNVFVLGVFFQGDSTGRALSHFFNISAKATTGATQTVTVWTTATATSSGSASTPTAATDSGFGTAAKVGVPVGTVAAFGLGAVMGWLLSWRNRRGVERQPESAHAVGGTGSHAGLQGSMATEHGAILGRENAVSEKAPPGELHGEGQRYELYGTAGVY